MPPNVAIVGENEVLHERGANLGRSKQGRPSDKTALQTVGYDKAHCEPILPMKTDTEGFRMNPLDVSESIDTWM